MNASSQYYSNEVREYPQQFGMQEYYAKEYLQDLGYSGASGWGYHNDVLYKETLRLLEAGRKDKMLLVTKTLDMHQHILTMVSAGRICRRQYAITSW